MITIFKGETNAERYFWKQYNFRVRDMKRDINRDNIILEGERLRSAPINSRKRERGKIEVF